MKVIAVGILFAFTCFDLDAVVNCSAPNPKPPPATIKWTCEDNQVCGPLLCMCVKWGGGGTYPCNGNCGANEQTVYVGTCRTPGA